MRCPYCGSTNSSVLDTRTTAKGNSTYRRRICDECGQKFSSIEIVYPGRDKRLCGDGKAQMTKDIDSLKAYRDKYLNRPSAGDHYPMAIIIDRLLPTLEGLAPVFDAKLFRASDKKGEDEV